MGFFNFLSFLMIDQLQCFIWILAHLDIFQDIRQLIFRMFAFKMLFVSFRITHLSLKVLKIRGHVKSNMFC